MSEIHISGGMGGPENWVSHHRQKYHGEYGLLFLKPGFSFFLSFLPNVLAFFDDFSIWVGMHRNSSQKNLMTCLVKVSALFSSELSIRRPKNRVSGTRSAIIHATYCE